MSVWNPATSTLPSGWGTGPTYSWCKWKPERHKAPVSETIIPKNPVATLLEDNGPKKMTKIKNGALFDLLPMDIINFIDDWIIGIEHNEAFNTLVEHTKILRSPVFPMLKNKHWVPYLYFENDLIYQEMKFNWADRYGVKSPCGFGPYTHLLEHNSE